MKCDVAQENIILVTYGELPDDRLAALEQHLADCEACNQELKALLAIHEALATHPMVEPSPNLLAQSRMRLDEIGRSPCLTFSPCMHGWDIFRALRR